MSSTSSSPNELTVPTPIIMTTFVDSNVDDGNEEEEVTETKIIGVTETGVIRKRSIKRKLTKEEKAKRGYGYDKTEYGKIVERVTGERIFRETIEGLQERLKMLEFMYKDCMDMVQQWEITRGEKIKIRKDKDKVMLTASIGTLFVCIVLYWMIGLVF